MAKDHGTGLPLPDTSQKGENANKDHRPGKHIKELIKAAKQHGKE